MDQTASGAVAMIPDLNDTAWFLDKLDLENGMANLIRADRSILAEQPFLDNKWDTSRLETASVTLADLTAAAPAGRPRLNFIWHTSFCCSTLIARCLDHQGRSLALREPRALVGLANAKRRGLVQKQPGLARGVFALLARRFEAPEHILIKPSNAANTLISEAAAMTDGKMLLLHTGCREFVVSAAKNGQGMAAFVRNLFLLLGGDGHPAGRWPVETLLRLTDLQMAALVWQIQMAHLEQMAGMLGDRAASLNAADFVAAPEAVMARLSEFFGIGLDAAAIAAAVNGPAFSRDAKAVGGSYDADARREAAAHIERTMGRDIEQAVAWSFAAVPAGVSGQRLPNPLWG